MEASEVAEVNGAAEVLRLEKITIEDFRVIQGLELSFILMF